MNANLTDEDLLLTTPETTTSTVALDDGSPVDLNELNEDPSQLISLFIAYAIIIAGLASVGFIFWGGISFVLSGGKEDKIKQAVETIRYAIIGLIVTLLAIVIVRIVGNAFNVDLVQYISFEEIFNLIENITGGGDGPQSLD